MKIAEAFIFAYLFIAFLWLLVLAAQAPRRLRDLRWHFGPDPLVVLLWWLVVIEAALCWPGLILLGVHEGEDE